MPKASTFQVTMDALREQTEEIAAQAYYLNLPNSRFQLELAQLFRSPFQLRWHGDRTVEVVIPAFDAHWFIDI